MMIDNIAKEVICFKGNFPVGNLCIYIDCGANRDNKKNGISHIYIKLLSSQYMSNVKDDNFRCVGYTDYMYTVINITFTESETNLQKLIEAIHIQDITSEEGNIFYEKSKKEIIMECKLRKDEIKKSLKVNSFIADKRIDYVPLGNIKMINSISYLEIIDFLRSNYRDFRCVFLLKQSHNIDSFCKEKDKTDNFQRIFDNNIHGIHTCKISNDNKQKSYFQIRNNTHIYYLCMALIEHVFIKKIENQLGLNVYFMKKKISNVNLYEILCLENKSKNMNDVVQFIINNKINEEDLISTKEEFIKHLHDDTLVDLNYAINNIINYFVYGESLLLDEKYIQKVIADLKRISISQVNQIKNETFNSSYWILLGY